MVAEDTFNGKTYSCHSFGLACGHCFRKGIDCDGDETEILDTELEELDIRGDK